MSFNTINRSRFLLSAFNPAASIKRSTTVSTVNLPRILIQSKSLSTINTSNPQQHGQTIARPSTAASNRPISPHVTIYKMPLPAIASITHRVTGSLLTVGVYSMGFLALFCGCDIPAYVDAFKSSIPILVPVAKLLVGFPLVFHTIAGCRHLVWDTTTKGLDLKSVELSSQIVLGSSIALSLILAFITI